MRKNKRLVERGVDLDSRIESTYAALLVEKIRRDLCDYAENLSISIPASLKYSFLECCLYNGVHYRDLIVQWVGEYVEKNGPEVCIDNIDQKIANLLQQREGLVKRIEVEGSIRARTIAEAVNDEVLRLTTQQVHGRPGTQYIERTRPIDYTSVVKACNKLMDRFNVDFAELYPYLVERGNGIANEMLRESLMAALAKLKDASEDTDSAKLQERLSVEQQLREWLASRENIGPSRHEGPSQPSQKTDPATPATIPNFGSKIQIQEAKQ